MRKKILKPLAVTVSLALLSFSVIKLVFDKNQLILDIVKSGLDNAHYSPQKIDDNFSVKFFDLYMKRLDNGKIWLMQADVDNMAKYKTKVDDQINNETFELFNLSNELKSRRILEKEAWYKEILAKPFDYKINEEYETDGEKASFAKNEAELKNRWRQLLQYQTLARLNELMLAQEKIKEVKAKKDTDAVVKPFDTLEVEARAKVLKTYNDFFKHLKKQNKKDRYAEYVNTITAMYDPHTEFFPPKEKKMFDQSMSGQLEGIGARLQQKDDYIKISELVIGYPASSTFSWTPGGQTTSTITGLTTGNYTCTVGIPGCVTPTYTTVVATVTSSGATPVLSISGTKTICSGNSTTLTGATATNYTWMPGNITTNTISVSPTTNTTYTLIGANGACTASVVATVTVNSNPTIILNNDSICANVATGTLSASGANTYTWSTGAQTTSITAAAGTYTVTGTDANGCKNMASASIVSVSLPTITTNVNSICIGVTSTLTASGGAANSYTWSPGGPNGNSTYIVTPASTTPIVVTGANSHGCLNTHTVTVNTTPTITVNDPTTCSGQSVTIQANPSTLSSYTWTGVSSSSSTASVAPNSTTSYTVLATDANGCVSNAAISTVSVTAATQISVASSNNPPCIGSTYTLTANGATTYTWIPSTGTFTSLDANSTQISVTQGTAAVTFSVSGVGSCPATPTVITINPAPVNSLTITTTPSNAVVCNGNSATFTASGASTYTWTPNITNGVAFTPASSQVYSVTGTDVNGCMGFDTVSVVVNPNPVLTVASQTICPTATTTLTAMPTTLTSYTWSTGSFADTTIVSPSVNSVYNVSATDANGCVGTTTASINIVNNLTVTALTTNSLPCLNSLDTLTASGAQSYTWTASNGNTTSISANNSTVTINPTTTTTYTVKGSSGTCLDSATVTVNIAPPLNITVTSNPANAIICAGDNITLSGNGASTYTWTGGITDNTPFNPSISQTYTVTGTDANGCTGTANQAVTVNPTPTVTINASSPAICVGQSATLTASGANTYTWSTTEMTPSITVSPIATQTYSVIGTSTNSCTNSNAPATVTITVNPLPTISIASNPVGSAVCFGSTATLTASGAQTYTWDSGSNTNPYSISPAVQTTYTVIGTDANSCSSFTTITIGVNPLPVAQTITASSPIVCKGAINPPVVLSVPNPGTWIGPAPSTATISANSTSISITQGGVYTLITSNSCGSAASAPYTAIADSVIANFTASPLVGQMPVTVNYTNTSVALSGNTIITNSWSFGDGNTSISVNPTEIFTNAGTYQTTLTVTDNLGCKDTATIYVVVNVVPPVIVIPNIFTPNGDGLNDIFSIDATGINNFDCKVYDRWGLLLHEWQGTSGGWDGKARNGNNCTDGTYFYIITYTDNYNKSSIKDGFFELIR